MKYIDPYSGTMLILTVALLVTYGFTKEVALLDLIKVSMGATLGVLAKKAETTVIVADPTTTTKILDRIQV